MSIDFSDVTALLEEWEEFDGDDVSVFVEEWASRLTELSNS